MKNIRHGFTLIELLVVMSIITLIASIIIVNTQTSRERARVAATLQFSEPVSRFLGSGLYAYWPLDEINAGTTPDVSNSGYLATTVGGVGIALGVIRNAFNFDGVDDMVSVDNFRPSELGSVSFWLKTPGKSGFNIRILGLHNNFEAYLNGTIGAVSNNFFSTGATGDLTGTRAVNDDKWHHILMVFDKNTALKGIYVDGVVDVEAVTQSNSSVPASGTLLLGHRDGAGSGVFYLGLLDEVRFFDEIYTAKEAGRLFAEGRSTHTLVSR